MFAQEKRQLILSEGEPVTISSPTGTPLSETVAVIGRATKQSQAEIAHEYHRKGIFIPEVNLPHGSLVKRRSTSEMYIVLSNLLESYKEEVLSQNTRMLEANALVTLSHFAETADADGNIVSGLVDKVKDLPAYITFIRAELVQYAQGLHPEAQYLIYMPDVNPEVLDTVTVKTGGRTMRFKVDTIDFISFEGIALIGVCTETRK